MYENPKHEILKMMDMAVNLAHWRIRMSEIELESIIGHDS